MKTLDEGLEDLSPFENFKKATVEITDFIRRACEIGITSAEYADGFACGMRNAREIYLSLEENK